MNSLVYVEKNFLKLYLVKYYYGITVDATADISHNKQNVLLLRFVSQDEETNKLQVSERFIKFITSKPGKAIANEIVST